MSLRLPEIGWFLISLESNAGQGAVSDAQTGTDRLAQNQPYFRVYGTLRWAFQLWAWANARLQPA